MPINDEPWAHHNLQNILGLRHDYNLINQVSYEQIKKLIRDEKINPVIYLQLSWEDTPSVIYRSNDKRFLKQVIDNAINELYNRLDFLTDIDSLKVKSYTIDVEPYNHKETRLTKQNLRDGSYFTELEEVERIINSNGEPVLIKNLFDADYHYLGFNRLFVNFKRGLAEIMFSETEYNDILNGNLILDISMPKKLDDWARCLRDIYINYYNVNKFKPNSAQLWAHLFNYKQQSIWGINSVTSNTKKQPYVSLAGIDLDKQAFEKRFKNYFN